jgi:23S rRNA pseudouridine1911/1915/1917 synthase
MMKGVSLRRCDGLAAVRRLSTFPIDMLPRSIKSWSGTGSDVNNLVLYEDKHLLVCYKPPNVLSTGVKKPEPIKHKVYIPEKANNLLDMLSSRHTGQAEPPFLVRGLDPFTSGIMIFTKSKLAKGSVIDQIRWNIIESEYLCVVRGRFSHQQTFADRTVGEINGVQSNLDLFNASSYMVLSCEPVAPSYRSAIRDGIETMLSVRQYTSYQKQLYKQFNAHHMTINEDDKHRALHCMSLTFYHPLTKARLNFFVEPPRWWFKQYPAKILENYLADGICNPYGLVAR